MGSRKKSPAKSPAKPQGKGGTRAAKKVQPTDAGDGATAKERPPRRQSALAARKKTKKHQLLLSEEGTTESEEEEPPAPRPAAAPAPNGSQGGLDPAVLQAAQQQHATQVAAGLGPGGLLVILGGPQHPPHQVPLQGPPERQPWQDCCDSEVERLRTAALSPPFGSTEAPTIGPEALHVAETAVKLYWEKGHEALIHMQDLPAAAVPSSATWLDAAAAVTTNDDPDSWAGCLDAVLKGVWETTSETSGRSVLTWTGAALST